MMDERNLVRQAILAREKSYSPYSGYMVGAALLTENGTVYSGCNIENVSYTPTICAERTAFSKAVSEGEKSFAAIAVAGWPKDSEPLSDVGTASCTQQGADRVRFQTGAYPCGVCLQVMMEFCDPESFRIIVAAGGDNYRVHTLKELLPYGFGQLEAAHISRP